MRQKDYRADIDGLRALAVLGVIAFHAGLPLHGGYVGVDVFFVISGYLITQIIIREVESGAFSFVHFWARRIRRILPAATLVILTSLFVGYFVLDPTAFDALGKSVIAQTFMLANVFFWRANGYFTEAAEMQPLLHTWSLSVEEQFYLVFPVFLVLVLRRSEWNLPILGCMAFASFVVSSLGVYAYPSSTFYLLPTRAWELAAGALVAMSEPRIQISSRTREITAVLGLMAIFLSMVVYTDSTPFPGVAALLPVGGSVAIIASNRQSPTFIGRVLSIKPIVAIGLISYSLYLWHWPVLVFFKHVLVEQSMVSTSVALLLTFVFSYLSWRFVEVPFRSSKRLRVPRVAFALGLLACSTVIALGILISMLQGIPARFDSYLKTIQSDILSAGKGYESISTTGLPLGMPQRSSHPPDFVLWGDSHGMVLARMIDDIAKEQNLTGLAHLSSGRPPVTGLWLPTKGIEQMKQTIWLNDNRLESIIESGTKNLILVGRWTGMYKGMLSTEIDERNGIPLTYCMVVDHLSDSPSYATSRAALARQLSRMLSRLNTSGIKVWLLIQVPSSSRAQVARDFFIYRRFPIFNDDFRWDTIRSNYEVDRKDSVELFGQLNASNLVIIDPVKSFYRNGDRLLLYVDRAFYKDEDHLTEPGAEYYLRDAFTHILAGMKIAKTSLK